MTTQDLYFGIQAGLQLLVGGGVVWGVVWLHGVLKRAIESQEKTIAAQAEQIKDQSTVLQDFKRLYEVADAPAMAQRFQSYKMVVDQEANTIVEQQTRKLEESSKTVSEVRQAYSNLLHDFSGVVGRMLPFVPAKERRMLIDTTALTPEVKELLHTLEPSTPTLGTLIGEHPTDEWWQRRAENR